MKTNAREYEILTMHLRDLAGSLVIPRLDQLGEVVDCLGESTVQLRRGEHMLHVTPAGHNRDLGGR